MLHALAMKRATLLLGVAALALGSVVVLALRSDPAHERAPVLPAVAPPASPSNAGEVALDRPADARSTAGAEVRARDGADARARGAGDADDRLSRAVEFLRALVPDRFGSLTDSEARALTTIDLRGAHIRDGDLAHLAALPALDSVSLRGSDVTDAGLADLRAVANLKSVDLRGTKATDLGVLALPTERLEALHLTDSAVEPRDLRWLPGMPKLQVFKLNGLALDDAALANLDFLPALRHLELDRTAITDDGLRRFLDRNPSVQRVELRETRVTPAAIEELARSHPGVELVDGRDVAMMMPR